MAQFEAVPMTIADGDMSSQRLNGPVVRAPRAGSEGQSSADEAWSLLVQQALGLGAPVSGGGKRQPEPPAPAVVGVPGGRSVTLPTSPADQDGIYRGLLWVAWAVEECSRAFTRISSRLGQVERRISDLESEKRSPTTPVYDVEAVEAVAPPGDVEDKLERLEAKLDEAAVQARRRVDGLEERLRQLDFVPLKVSNLQRSVDQVVSAQRRATAEEQRATDLTPPPSAEIVELRDQLAAVQSRLVELEARANERANERTNEEAPAPAVDVEGVYRELDAVAEFVAARAASTAESLERIGPLEMAVLELRRDVGRVLTELAGTRGTKEADGRLRDVEARLHRLERSGQKVDRLYAALEGLVRIREVDTVSRPAANGFTAVEPG